ncbi:MAG: 4,5-DOPA dioxygenase extradiol [Pseudomonadota bacterium]
MTSTPTFPRMPAAFIGHGSPMNTLEVNRFTAAWRELGRSLPRPRAVLAISAHWFIGGSAVTAMARPRVIHDFYGFPQPLADFDYPAPGAPDVAQEIAEVVRPQHLGLDQDSWGLDHGTWSVLAHVFPDASIPVVQLSIYAGAPASYHIELGAKLAPLRDRGVFILGSGNVVHNLRRLNPGLSDQAFDWGQRFDAEVQRVMTTVPAELPDVMRHPDYALSAPTPEHFIPLLYLAGLCSAAGQPARAFAQGGVMGGITMTSFLLGGHCPSSAQANGDGTGGALPDPAVVPPEQTNL